MFVAAVFMLLAAAALPFVQAQCAVEQYGARGDGTTDCTSAVTRALQDCAGTGGEVTFGNGTYLFSTTVMVPTNVANGLTIRGIGYGSILLWASDADLISFTQASPVAHVRVESLSIYSVNATKSNNSTALRFPAGFVRSTIENVLFIGQQGGAAMKSELRTSRGQLVKLPPVAMPPLLANLNFVPLGTCIDMGQVSDTSNIINTLIWMTTGTGVVIGRGSEVRIIGGRIIGACKYCNSIGVHVTGNNGGVHLLTTDVISLNQGLVLDNSSGAGSNREIFVTHATLDSNWRGLSVFDNSYISVAGCWAASSDQDNIWFSPSATGSIMVITGGTIFNAGAEGGDPTKAMCNGIVINAGRVTLNGVLIRDNKGIGVWVPGNVSHTLVNGCQIFDNGQNLDLMGNDYMVSASICTGSTKPNNFGPSRASAVVANNIGCE